ncbi:MAG: hypothetical protein U9P79_02040 [Candidatus Cloacimonadota bacterium]|nr:hypothetical protein [Candidatus Cloacimonadota bacterium]
MKIKMQSSQIPDPHEANFIEQKMTDLLENMVSSGTYFHEIKILFGDIAKTLTLIK